MKNEKYKILESSLYPFVRIDCEETLDGGLIMKKFFTVDKYEFEPSDDIGDLSWKRPAFWIISSSISIYSNKLLLVKYNFPLTLSAFYFGLLLFAYIITARYDPRLNLQATEGGPIASKSWTWMVAASFASAVALPMFMEALLHMSSLPALAMLFPVIFLVESITLFVFVSPSHSSRRLSLETIRVAFFISLILYDEYRLTVPGVICTVGAFMTMGLSRASFIIASHRGCNNEDAILPFYHYFISMATAFGFLVSGLLAFIHETNVVDYCPKLDTIVLFFISSASTVGAGIAGTSLVVYSPICFSDKKHLDVRLLVSPSAALISGFSSSLVMLISMIFGPVAVISWLQLTSYFLAIPCLVGYSRVLTFFKTMSDYVRSYLLYWSYHKTPSHTQRKLYTSLLQISLTAVITISFYVLSIARLYMLSSGPAPSLDTTYNPGLFPFDIVISAYKESPESISQMLKAIQSTSYISSVNHRIIIYTKDPEISLSMLKNSTGADIVERLPNLGREGGTYLNHIVTHWDNLATQTMFIQAHAHNMRELIPRINSYLVPRTGMLSLGFSEATCSCKDCGDRFGWKDNWTIVPSLYESIYGTNCTNITPILLSYKGQFIASARRIRGIKRGTYEKLLSAITSGIGWSHDPRFNLIDEQNSPDNPSFGFAVERIWGLLMQCANDERVSTRCPSMISGMTRGGDVGDCQCLDAS